MLVLQQSLASCGFAKYSFQVWYPWSSTLYSVLLTAILDFVYLWFVHTKTFYDFFFTRDPYLLQMVVYGTCHQFSTFQMTLLLSSSSFIHFETCSFVFSEGRGNLVSGWVFTLAVVPQLSFSHKPVVLSTAVLTSDLFQEQWKWIAV